MLSFDSDEAKERTQEVDGVRMLRFRGAVLPLLSLREVLKLPNDVPFDSGFTRIVVVQSEGRRYAIEVDNLRGQILPVLDLRERLQLSNADKRSIEDTRMAVVRTDEGLLTLLIDRVGEILDVDSDNFEPPAETLKPGVRAVTSHICKLDNQLLLILDLAKLSQLPDLPTAIAGQHDLPTGQAVSPS
jgi:chemotaxis signal transduction protein